MGGQRMKAGAEKAEGLKQNVHHTTAGESVVSDLYTNYAANLDLYINWEGSRLCNYS